MKKFKEFKCQDLDNCDIWITYKKLNMSKNEYFGVSQSYDIGFDGRKKAVRLIVGDMNASDETKIGIIKALGKLQSNDNYKCVYSR